MSSLFTKKFYLAFLLLFFSFSFSYGAKKKEVPFSSSELNLLSSVLTNKEWSKAEINSLYNKDILKITNLIEMNVTKPIQLKRRSYAHFYNKSSIKKATAFKRKWRTTLRRAQEAYGVDENVIVGILWVETRFGQFTGTKPILSVFSSVYVDCHKLLADKNSNLTDKQKKRVIRKQNWALGELKSILKIRKKYNFEIFEIKGSYAGAFGIPQFLPSSFLNWAVTAPKTGKRLYPKLFWEPDAIFSVANYLKSHGFKMNQGRQVKYKAIWKYNNSKVYADTILKVASSL